MAAIDIQDQMEAAWYELIRELDWDTETTVRRWRQGGLDVAPPTVVIQGHGLFHGPGNRGRFWEVFVRIAALTYAPDDPDQVVLNELHDKALRRAMTVTNTELTAQLTGITVQGIHLDGTEATADENYQEEPINLRIHCEALLTAPSTTTT